MILDIFNHIFSMQLIAPTKRAWIYEGSACRLLLLPARHGANRAFGWPDLLRRTTAAGAASADNRCVLRPQDDGKAHADMVPVDFNSVSLVRKCGVLTRTNLCLLEFAGTAVERA
jgi:hypothetical protein